MPHEWEENKHNAAYISKGDREGSHTLVGCRGLEAAKTTEQVEGGRK